MQRSRLLTCKRVVVALLVALGSVLSLLLSVGGCATDTPKASPAVGLPSTVESWSGPTAQAPTQFPVRDNSDWGYVEKWGYIDRSGRVVIDFQYDGAEAFSDGLAAVKLDGKWGYIDESGTTVIPLQAWEKVGEFNEGLAPVSTVNSQVLTQKAAVTTYLDKTGKEVIPADSSWSDGASFSEGLAGFSLLGSGVGFIDTRGKVAILLPYDVFPRPFSEGLAAVADAPYRWGYIDASGAFVIQPRFQSATEFSNGRAVVRDGEGFLIIDKRGETVARLPYRGVLGLGNGLAPALVWEGEWPEGDGAWGYVDPSGALVIPAQFFGAHEFSGGLAMVSDKNDKIGYIDARGNYVWQER